MTTQTPPATDSGQTADNSSSGSPVTATPADVLELPGTGDGETRAAAQPDSEVSLRGIFDLVKAATGHDFSSYKLNTVMRRIERRMSVHNLPGLGSYSALLKDSAEEAEALCREILIGVTSFFRDAEAFDVLKRDIIPRLFANRNSDEPVRIWHPCCASGEEVYSMAMLIREHLDSEGLNVKVQFFATDLDEAAIAQARAGLYSEEVAAEVGAERLSRFFTPAGGQWLISKQLRESIIFAQHSLIKDPPFSRLDLLVCRNFLIYITPDMQKRLFSLFHQVLKPGGLLFLGAAETVGNSDLFAPLDKKWKIYQRLETGRREFPFPISSTFRRAAAPLRSVSAGEPGLAHAAVAERLLSERYAPPHVIVNERYQVVHVSDRANRYLKIPAGGPTRDLLKMAVEELRPALRAAIYKCFSEEQSVVFRGVKSEGGASRVNVVVDPIPPAASGKLALVVLEAAPSPAEEGPAGKGGAGDDGSRDMLVRQLEEQLRVTQEQLLAVTEQLETSHEGFLSVNEELMSINEEFQSANEELQSTNEELETSKEELQALNEELVTVNAELHAKVEELNRANSDVENLLKSSEIATIFLDRELRIKRYTAAMAAVFNLIPADIGRPFSHFASAVDWSGLAADAAQVLKSRLPLEREVAVAKDGRHYLMRVLPYLGEEALAPGVVVTLVDLTERKRMEDALLKSKEEWERTFDAVPDLIAIIDGEHRIVRANRTMAERLGTTPEACVGRHCYRDVHCGNGPSAGCPHVKTLRDGREHRVEFREERLGGDFLITTTPLFDEMGIMTGTVHVARDITDRKEAEEELRRSKRQLEQQLAQLQAILDHLSDGVVIADLEGNLYHWNPAAVAIHGFGSMEECRRDLPAFAEIFELSCEEEGILPMSRWPLARILAGETLHGWEVRVRRRDRDWSRVFSYGGTLACDKSGAPVLAVVSITDVTEPRRIQAALSENQRRLGLALDAGLAAPWEVDLETGRQTWDVRLFELLCVAENERDDAQLRSSEFVLPEDRPRVTLAFKAACREGAPAYYTEFRARRRDGEVRWYASRGKVVEEGGRRRMVGVIQEITERKRAEELIQRHVEDLETTNLELTRFNEVSVGRELRMIELKKEINELCARGGDAPRYPLAFEEEA